MLFTSLECGKKFIDEIMEITPWVKEFVEKFSNEERMKKYLSERRESSSYGIWPASRKVWFFLSLQYNITPLDASGTFVRDIDVSSDFLFGTWTTTLFQL